MTLVNTLGQVYMSASVLIQMLYLLMAPLVLANLATVEMDFIPQKLTIVLITPLIARIFVLFLDLVLLNVSAVIQMPILQKSVRGTGFSGNGLICTGILLFL
jgi:hypothetical protein